MSHAKPRLVEKPWLIPNLHFVANHISGNQHLMSRGYEDICLMAKTSSSSISGGGSFRDMVLENTFQDVVDSAIHNEIPMLIYAGIRNDRRGKYRLICSFDGRFRIIDFLLNNGSYEICEHNKILGKYTTEGYNNQMMWPELAKMSDRRGNKVMICLDYSGYDTQISLAEYVQISELLNKHRIHSDIYGSLWAWYSEWMLQPKPLVTRSSEGLEHLIPHYHTLASGLHGTHSFENLIGISTSIEAVNKGVEIYDFWSNGDDQNTLINSTDLDSYIHFLEKYYDISWEKSLVGHKLSVWGKLWFAQDYHPMWEIGTFRSIWERESGDTSYVEDSKFQSNYCKILQVAITLIRLGKEFETVKRWIDRLCDVTNIDPSRVPAAMNNISSSTNASVNDLEPRGLISVKKPLMDKTFHLTSLANNNYFDMLYSMYKNNVFYSLEVKDPEYHESGTIIRFNRGVDYSRMVPRDVPWIYKELYRGVDYSLTDQLARDILQSTKSYDGPCSQGFSFTNMYEMSYALNERNSYIWKRVITG
jgi:hypothetical protein